VLARGMKLRFRPCASGFTYFNRFPGATAAGIRQCGCVSVGVCAPASQRREWMARTPNKRMHQDLCPPSLIDQTLLASRVGGMSGFGARHAGRPQAGDARR
jgi:hypothetical protein